MRRTKSKNEIGALMVEYTVVALALIGLLGAIIDLGIGLHYWSVLNHYTISTTQIEAKHCSDCDRDIVASTKSALEKAFDGNFGKSAPATVNVRTIPPTIVPAGTLVPASLVTEATLDYHCFLCIFLGNLRLSASCQATIELD